MSKFGLIGKKLGHSFSAEIHKAFGGYDYSLIELSEYELKSFFSAREFSGVNVTIPYKEAVIPLLDEISDSAKAIGSVNTVVNKNGRLIGYNTDFGGMNALIKKMGLDLSGKKIAILGSGGTSKTAYALAKELKAREIYVVSRRKADGFITYDELYSDHKDVEILINATPCGMFPNIGESPLDISHLDNLCGVIDAIYNPLSSKLVLQAKEKGINAEGGLFMLVAQAALAVELFKGEPVSAESILDIYKSIYSKKENIVLIGMPASGKTTIGKIIAENLCKEFYDTDELIARKYGKSIPEIFSEIGESGFRKLESEAIKEIAAKQGCVIATGGGAVLCKNNIDTLKQNGRVVFIDRSLDSLIPTSDRPLSANREALEKRYKERYDIYCQSADIHISCGDDALENATNILKEMSL